MPRLLNPRSCSAVPYDSPARKPKSSQLPSGDPTARATQKLDPRIERLLACETSFVASESFRNPATARRLKMFAEQWDCQAVPAEVGNFSTKNATLATCANGVTQLLSADEEREAFLCLNYLKWQANVLRATIDLAAVDELAIAEIEALHRQARMVRDRIISANLRLVMSIAKAQTDGRLNFDELFSEGVPILMRAVEKFDVERGFRFSTYAFTAVRRTLHHAKAKAQLRNRRERTSVESSVLDSQSDNVDSSGPLTKSAASVLHDLLERLPSREKFVVQARFGMLPNQADCTLKEVGDFLGVSKERARQLLNRALDHLRTFVERSGCAELHELAEFGAADTSPAGI